MRWLPNSTVDRAETRIVGAWRATKRLSLALEWNPGEDELLPNFNFAPSLPGEHVPGVGLVVGTSSDRIGTPEGRAWFASASLNPHGWGWELPVNGYLGAAYGTFADDLRAIGGLRWRVTDELSLSVQHDGEQVHGILSMPLSIFAEGDAWSRWHLDLLLVEVAGVRTAGITLGTRF
ncbi:MAG: hypothetical protein ACYTF3_06160 [Planctomycetota bacterium]